MKLELRALISPRDDLFRRLEFLIRSLRILPGSVKEDQGDPLAEKVYLGLRLLSQVFGFKVPGMDIDAEQHAKASRDVKALQTPDERLQRLSFALFGQTNDTILYRGLVPEKPDLAAISADVIRLSSLSDQSLMSHANDIFSLKKIDLMSTFSSDRYAWIKVNHGWWEQVTGYAFETSGVNPAGVSRAAHYYESTSSQDIMFRSLQLIATPTNTAGSFDFINSEMAFAISFNGGNLWNDEVTSPLPPHIRGAMLGAAPFFRAATGGERFNVADGAAAKKLAYANKLGDFCALVRARSDLALFIVPDHLKTIGVVDFEGDESHIIVPSSTIHELWPVTLAYVAGEVAKVLLRYKRVTVFVQAAAISFPISVLIMHLARNLAANVHLYDLGQVLDLAEPEGHRTKTWARDAYPQGHDCGFTLR
jgi:hypothetical protein